RNKVAAEFCEFSSLPDCDVNQGPLWLCPLKAHQTELGAQASASTVDHNRELAALAWCAALRSSRRHRGHGLAAAHHAYRSDGIAQARLWVRTRALIEPMKLNDWYCRAGDRPC